MKELRLRDISTIEAANAYAAEFMADFNARFGKEPRNPKDMHRPLADHENLDGALCRKEIRTLTQALTLRYDKVMFILHPTDTAKKLARKKVVVCDYLRTDVSRSFMRASLCPTRSSMSCVRFTGRQSSRTSGSTLPWRWLPRCRSAAICSAASAGRAAPARRTTCSESLMALRATVM
ncbi:hypothetical protein MES5069_760049 [Mesorhizobium escarrei]|uniref:Uncharacterized protein n=1 Tax=Mesorhizobium escarrei TaxID=666018 RepID=A0ABM9EIH4_9HYPH|nr:hypothetical protein MES5069_760049 [Mesorhizobium escarrei]